MENQLNQMKLKTTFDTLARQHMKEIYKMRKANDMAGLQQLQEQLIAEAQAQVAGEAPFKFTAEQVEAYTTVGGTPHLDNQYTVFGEVTEGMEVVDAIQQVKTNRADLPEEDVVIKPLQDQYTITPGIAGASILGDGSVSLIIDVSQLLDLGVKQELNAREEREAATNK